MRKSLRETMRAIKDAGGTDVTIEQGGRHTLVRFTAADGSHQHATLHRGEKMTHRVEAGLRSKLRKGGI